MTEDRPAPKTPEDLEAIFRNANENCRISLETTERQK